MPPLALLMPPACIAGDTEVTTVNGPSSNNGDSLRPGATVPAPAPAPPPPERDQRPGGPAGQRLAADSQAGNGFPLLFRSAVRDGLGVQTRVLPAGLGLLTASQFRSVSAASAASFILDVQLPGNEQAKPSPVASGSGVPVWIDFSPPLARGVLEVLLGMGTAKSLAAGRAMTAVERGLLRRVAEAAARSLGQALSRNAPAALSIGGAPCCLDHPRFSDQTVAILSYVMTAGSGVGRMRLCMPCNALEAWLPAAAQVERDQQPIELTVTLGETRASDQELKALAPGDVLFTEAPMETDVLVRLAGVAKFTGMPGRWGGLRAVCVTGRLPATFAR